MIKKNSFLIIFSVVIVFIFSLVGVINYFVDPSGIYNLNIIKKENNLNLSSNFVKEIVKLKEGGFKYNNNFTVREMKTDFAQLKTNNECAIIGSSRIMIINSNEISHSFKSECSSFINLGVPGASLEDIFIYSYLLNNNINSPKKIVIEITPWILNYNRDARWLEFSEYFVEMNKVINKNSVIYESDKNLSFYLYENLFNIQYFYESINLLRKNLFNNKYDNKLLPNNYFFDFYTSEGSLIMSQESTDNHEKKQKKIVPINNYKIFDQEWYDENAVDNFNNLIVFLKKNFDIFFIFTPYHPSIFETSDQPLVLAIQKIENLILNIAKLNKVKIIGSFYPSKSNCKLNEFRSNDHPYNSCLKKLSFINN